MYSIMWNMKTSLVLDDHLYQEAQRVAREKGKTLSETISEWARLGRKVALEQQRKSRGVYQPVDLGEPLLDIGSRRDWMDMLDE